MCVAAAAAGLRPGEVESKNVIGIGCMWSVEEQVPVATLGGGGGGEFERVSRSFIGCF